MNMSENLLSCSGFLWRFSRILRDVRNLVVVRQKRQICFIKRITLRITLPVENIEDYDLS